MLKASEPHCSYNNHLNHFCNYYYLNNTLQLQQAFKPKPQINKEDLNHNQSMLEVCFSMMAKCPWVNTIHHRESGGFGNETWEMSHVELLKTTTKNNMSITSMWNTK